MLKVGDKVKVQMFNTPEGRFYGPVEEAEIIEIDHSLYNQSLYPRPYKVIRKSGMEMWVQRKEIKGVIR